MPNTPIGLDADGVLFDFDAHWSTVASRVLGRPLITVDSSYSLQSRYGLTKSEHDLVWGVFNHDVEWANVPLYDFAKDLVYALEDMGAQVYVVTSLRSEFLPARVDSFCGLIPSARILTVNPSRAAISKASVLRELKALSFLDDHPDNANAIARSVITSVLLNRNYNDLPETEHEVPVIDDPMDYPVLVEDLLRRVRRIA